jgi:hypothetical protein
MYVCKPWYFGDASGCCSVYSSKPQAARVENSPHEVNCIIKRTPADRSMLKYWTYIAATAMRGSRFTWMAKSELEPEPARPIPDSYVTRVMLNFFAHDKCPRTIVVMEAICAGSVVFKNIPKFLSRDGVYVPK